MYNVFLKSVDKDQKIDTPTFTPEDVDEWARLTKLGCWVLVYTLENAFSENDYMFFNSLKELDKWYAINKSKIGYIFILHPK